MLLPPAVWFALAWHRRWITDDGLIVARTVRQILAGHGPVFNAGERVEADTSAVWTWLLAGIAWVSRADVYSVMLWTAILLAPAGLLLALLGARRLHRRIRPGRAVFPLGAMVVLGLPPFWDFATSGLEEPLVFCWLGLCWWLMAGVGPGTPRRAAALAFVAGLGWVVRPDMAIGTVCFLAALGYAVRPGRRRAAALLAVAGAVPLAYEIFRMGYYGMLVPNTAIAKQASVMHPQQGWMYLVNYEAPYHLWAPTLLLAALAPAVIGWRALDRTARACVGASVASGVLMAGYVVAIGGDFMHARMLLPATFALLLPFMAVPAPDRVRLALRPAAAADGQQEGTVVRLLRHHHGLAVALAATVTAAGAFACAAWFRLPQQPNIIPSDGITNERAYWVDRTGVPNPTTGAPYVQAMIGLPQGPPDTLGWVIMRDAKSGRPVLLMELADQAPLTALPLDRPGATIAIPGDVLGTLGAVVPLDGVAIDQHGLSFALAAHLQPGHGRVGHAQYAAPVWIVADYTAVASAPGVPAGELAAARRALGCGGIGQLQQATQAPMSWNRFLRNAAESFTLSRLRIPDDPLAAVGRFCR